MNQALKKKIRKEKQKNCLLVVAMAIVFVLLVVYLDYQVSHAIAFYK